MSRGHQTKPPIVRLIHRVLAENVTLARFVIVGGLGYAVYQVLLFATYDWSLLWFLPQKDVSARIIFFEHGDVRFLISTLVDAEIAVLAVFVGHSLWTFRDRAMVHKPLLLRFGQFHANQVVSFGIGIVMINVLTVQVGFYHFVSVPIAAAAAGVWNLMWAMLFIWRRAGPGEAAW